MGKLTALLEGGQSSPAQGKIILYPDADRNWKAKVPYDGLGDLTKRRVPRNWIQNSQFAFAQRQSATVPTAYFWSAGFRAHIADRWVISAENLAVNYFRESYSTYALPARYGGNFTKTTNAGKFVVSQCIEGASSLTLRGRVVRFHFWGRNAASSSTISFPMRFGLLSLASPGTIDSPPSTLVTSFGSALGDVSFAANLTPLRPFLIENGEVGKADSSPNYAGITFSRYWSRHSACFMVPSDCLNLIPVIWPHAQLAVNDTFSLTAVGLYDGYDSIDYMPLSEEDDLRQCQRFYAKTCTIDQQPIQNLGINTGEFKFIAGKAGAATESSHNWWFPERMRATPATVTTYNPAAADAHVRDETAAVTCTATTIVGATDRQLALTCTGNASTAVGNLLGIHISADASL